MQAKINTQKADSATAGASANHTPGPWEVWQIPGNDFNGDIVESNGTHIARAVAHDGDEVKAEANARLIAAAPALLSALTAMMDAYSNGNELPSYEASEPAWIEARAAIAKAEGTNL